MGDVSLQVVEYSRRTLGECRGFGGRIEGSQVIENSRWVRKQQGRVERTQISRTFESSRRLSGNTRNSLVEREENLLRVEELKGTAKMSCTHEGARVLGLLCHTLWGGRL